jgi:hypothetical protein
MKATEETSRIIEAIKQVDKLDLDKLFASGIDITINSYTDPEREHVSRVTIHAEDAYPVKVALRDALMMALERHRESLTRQLRDIEAINPGGKLP